MMKWKSRSRRIMSFRHRRADGSIRDVEIFGTKIRLDGRDLVYDVVHDITTRKRLELVNTFRLRLIHMAETHSVRELLQKTLDQAEKITESSIGFCHFVDADQERLVMQAWSTNTLRRMCTADEESKHYSLDQAGVWADALRQRKTVIHNDYAVLPNRKGMPEGHAVVTRELVVPILRDSKAVAIFGIGNKPTLYDSGDVKLVEMLANQIWDIVAKKMAEENQKQLQVQLEHAKKMEMVGQLAAGISHEINNPLSFLLIDNGNLLSAFDDISELVNSYRSTIEKAESAADLSSDLQLIREKEKNLALDTLLEEIPGILKVQKGGLERISEITKSMRGYSYKGISDSLVLFDINKAVKEVLAISKNEYASSAAIHLKLESREMVRCNPSQIHQVLLNLVLNSIGAIKSQKRREPGSVTIETWSADGSLYCSVTDDGPGIPDEIRDKVFSPFFTTKAIGEGTGLGLSICYDIIVTQHHGSITLDPSSRAGGASFTFTLPLPNADTL